MYIYIYIYLCIYIYIYIFGENHHLKEEINYSFEIMSAKTMQCPMETDKHEVLAKCLFVSDGHYIVLVCINSK